MLFIDSMVIEQAIKENNRALLEEFTRFLNDLTSKITDLER